MSSDKTVQVRGFEGTLCREGKGEIPPTYLFSDGRFGAKVGEAWVFRASLKSLEKLIRKGRPSVRLFQAELGGIFHHLAPRVFDVSEMSDSRVTDKEGKKHYLGYGEWFLYDEQIVKELRALEEERAKFERDIVARFHQITKRARKVDKSHVKELIKSKPLEE